MSRFTADDPVPGDSRSCDAIETVIVPRARDLGGFEVRRALPSAQRQMVGPFIFWDQMGPAQFHLGEGIDVRPHPHIGLATLTYLFAGAIVHRDSLGTEMEIQPGEVNLMVAGSGIVHSERTGQSARQAGASLFGIQSWIALPTGAEETAPAFHHHGKGEFPVIEADGAHVRVIAGSFHGETSPMSTFSEMIYCDARLRAGGRLELPPSHDERAIYIVEGEISIADDQFRAGRLLAFRPGDQIIISAASDAHFLIVGGEPMDGPRYIWWNFVSSSQERIAQAKEDWRQRRFDSVPGDDEEFIPLPDR